jgi:DNA-binding LacI/PurR family transcriptional regulator
LLDSIEKSKLQHLTLSQDFGIISYNETVFKNIIGNSITTISTEFEVMERILAEIILNGKKEKTENKCTLIVRNSL